MRSLDVFEIDWARGSRSSNCHDSQEIQRRNSFANGNRVRIATKSSRRKFDSAEIEHIDMEIFDVAYHIIGGGDEGDKTVVSTKEEADHSLPYLISVALLDGQVMPEQYTVERITRGDVQGLLHKVTIRPSDEFSNRFPKEMPCRLNNDAPERSCSE